METPAIEVTATSDHDAKRLRTIRDYFESGCLCIHQGRLQPSPASVSDIEAIDRYEKECACSRNYKELEVDGLKQSLATP